MIQLVNVDYGFIDSVLQKHGCDKSKGIAIMQDIQSKYNFLPKDALKYVAEKIGESEAELYGVATFYENFSMNEKGKYIIKVCNGTACHVRKSDDVQEALYAATGMKPEDHMSEDGLFTIERVSCLGACGLAPVCTVNDVVHPAMTPEKMYQLIAQLREGEN
jgi:NADH-quinone oxidoreductase subunit E